MTDGNLPLPGGVRPPSPARVSFSTRLLFITLLVSSLLVWNWPLSGTYPISKVLCWTEHFWKSLISGPGSPLPDPSSGPKWIVPGAEWLDTEGNPIQAHGGGLLKVHDIYYWFGEDKRHHGSNFRAVSCYVSADLYLWTRLPDALAPLEGTSISNESVVERPKVIYNPFNHDYVMWFHSDNLNYNAAEVGVAVSRTPEGPYTYISSFKPFGADSRDEGLYVDDDGSAYLLYASDWNNNFKIAQLTPDYRDVSHVTHVFYGGGYEAPGIIKKNGTYHLFISDLTGWWPNPNSHLSAPSLSGPWTKPTDIAPPKLRTYFSQNTYDLVLQPGDDEGQGMISLYMGDRWKSSQLGRSSYVWLPMTWKDDGTVWLDWVDIFSVDLKTGAVTIPTGTTYHAAYGMLHGTAQLGNCTACASKRVVHHLGAGGSVTIPDVQGSGGEHWVSVSYSNADWNWRETTVRVNGGPSKTLAQPDTQNGAVFLSVPIKVELRNSSDNYITFGHNQTTYAGDLDKIIVYA
ncbi:carbohydrate-binding module family 35 protein [Calocera viscosa TUFC12733]|uniref:Carbohydrate-binding module family 35 protein n=1 Tax=Calocera viscosa (strain TUFC12733) TaxID=1330018 RepID=A0A167FST1_CALVF|nr:carbohydrate-binding module family 35 protein [Calocera viscosa TUFC12733]